jgi:hypothetical protein
VFVHVGVITYFDDRETLRDEGSSSSFIGQQMPYTYMDLLLYFLGILGVPCVHNKQYWKKRFQEVLLNKDVIKMTTERLL